MTEHTKEQYSLSLTKEIELERQVGELRERELKTMRAIKVFLECYLEQDDCEAYSYSGDWLDHFSYCSDRMNGGRAKSIISLLDQALGGVI